MKLRGFAADLQQRQSNDLELTIEVVDAMDPFNFELLLGMIFEANGYRVTETPTSADQGADVFAEKAGIKTVVQAKLYSAPVGDSAVQEVVEKPSSTNAMETHRDPRTSDPTTTASFA